MSRRRPYHRRLQLIASPFIVGILGAGCEDRPRPATGVAVSDSAGITVVTVPGDYLEQPIGWELAPEPHLRVGTIDGGDETQLSQIASVARLSDGSIFLSEGGARRLRLVASDGSFRRWIGDVGDGPAEYGLTGGVGVLDGDTLWAWDARRRRVVLFNSDGGYVRGFQPQPPGEVSNPRSVSLLPDGRVVHQGSNIEANLEGGEETFREEVTVALLDREGAGALRLTSTFGAAYRFMEIPLPDGGTSRGLALVDPTFHPLPRVVTAADRVLVADPGPFEIREFDLAGTLLRIVRVNTPPRPVTPTLIRGFEEARLDGLEGRSSAQIRDWLDGLTYADHLPHFEEVRVDSDGGLWLSEFSQHREGGPRRWWRIAEDGVFEGFLDLPQGLRFLTFDRDELFGAVRDEWGVPYLVAYRVTRD